MNWVAHNSSIIILQLYVMLVLYLFICLFVVFRWFFPALSRTRAENILKSEVCCGVDVRKGERYFVWA